MTIPLIMRWSVVKSWLTVLLLGAGLFWISSVDAVIYSGEEFPKIIERAESLSKEDFEDLSKREMPGQLANMGYDQYREVRFKTEQALWKNTSSAFQIQLFHLGFLYKWPVRIHIMDRQGIKPLAFNSGFFDYGQTGFKDFIPPQFAFAGFRVHYPINKPDYWDEVVAFLGASYFRAVAQDLNYGLSARGLAVNTGLSSGEEFPYFTEFWLEQPPQDTEQMTIYALLDSPSVTGAFQFVVKPGEETTIEVNMVLFPRRDIAKVGIAPLTSMYFYGENQPPPNNHRDFRPEVHDSDGLLIHAQNGEWIWRPLMNPERLLINSFDGENVKGFGLLQRDMNFDHYQDLEARSDVRPSAWVAPQGEWGRGHVELLQIPTTNEYNDNMNAFWVPEEPLQAGQRAEYRYSLKWFPAALKMPALGYVTDTRMVWEKNNEIIMFILEYAGEELKKLPETTEIFPDIAVAGGYDLIDRQVIKNKVTGGWRLVFRIERGHRDYFKDMIPSQKLMVDLRAVLKSGDKTLTETWIYSFLP